MQAPYISKVEVKEILTKLNLKRNNSLIDKLRKAVWVNDLSTSARIRDSESVGAVNESLA